LANNNLSGAHLQQLHRYLPNLVNLSLQNNAIADKREISMIVPKKDKMIHLRELVLMGNPLRETAYKTGAGDVYRSYVIYLYSSKVFTHLYFQ
jgi:nuclear RNA export factor